MQKKTWMQQKLKNQSNVLPANQTSARWNTLMPTTKRRWEIKSVELNKTHCVQINTTKPIEAIAIDQQMLLLTETPCNAMRFNATWMPKKTGIQNAICSSWRARMSGHVCTDFVPKSDSNTMTLSQVWQMQKVRFRSFSQHTTSTWQCHATHQWSPASQINNSRD